MLMIFKTLLLTAIRSLASVSSYLVSSRISTSPSVVDNISWLHISQFTLYTLLFWRVGNGM